MKRYRIGDVGGGRLGDEQVARAVEDPEGQWVRLDDHRAEGARVRGEIAAALAAERAATAPQGPPECPCLKCQAFESARATLDSLVGAP